MKKVMVVGEFMSRKDAENGGAFSDGNGRMVKALLAKSGVDPRECMFVNVFPLCPARNTIFSLCGTQKEGIPGVKYLRRGSYVRAEYAPHLHNLWKQINEVRPNLILALGDAPLWALTSETKIDYARGYITHGNSAIPDVKVLPTYSPRQVQNKYDLRPIVLADFEKAAREKEFPEIRRPSHEIWLEPTITDLEDFYHKYLRAAPAMSVDIENKPGMITCIGFAPDPSIALVVPFYDSRHEDGNYWRTRTEEIIAWRFVRRMLTLGKSVYGQNYSYDMQVLWRLASMPNPCFTDDTMLMHHAMQPEMKKSLGFLASIYANEVAWKRMRTDTIKKED